MHAQSEPIPLRDIVYFLINEAPEELGITKLMKLVFLADIEHMQLYGERLCDIEWGWYNFGPFSPSVYGAVETLDAEGLVQDVLMTERRTIRRAGMLENETPTCLHARHRYAIRRILSRYGKLSLPAIKQVAYATETMQNAKQGERLDISREKRKSLSESSAALSSLIQRSEKPDLRAWGDPAESAAEDREIFEKLTGMREAANAMHRV